MKKIFSILLAITFVASAFCVPVFATAANQTSTAYIQYGTTAHDLRAYGLHTFSAYRVSAVPSLTDDGIDPAQYGLAPADVATLGDGLTLTNSTANQDFDYTADYGADADRIKLTSYLAYNDEYVFIGERLETPVEIKVTDADGTVGTLNTNVRYGLNQSTAIPEAAARLSNTYAYEKTANGYVVKACVSGNRNYKAIDGQVTKSATLDQDQYADWDLQKYSKNTAVAASENNGIFTYDFEYRIPLADVIFSAVGSYDAAEVAKLLANPEFFGSYMFQVLLTRDGSEGKTPLYLSTGYARDRVLTPYDAHSKAANSTWGKAVQEFWTNSKGESLSVSYVPSPVIHGSANGPVIPSATGFRPALTGFKLGQIESVYKIGQEVSFTMTPDGLENTAPVVGDLRVIPTGFRVRNDYDTKLKGEITDFTSAKFSTAKLPVGLNTLVVTFTQQRFDGSKWVDTSVTKNLSHNFTVTGTVLSASTGSAQTGDNLTVFAIAGSVMALAVIAVASIVVVSKKKSKF